ncbi:MAG: phospholipid/cholesterol/gamma-HCH transport system substrate-binding protein [Frankiaceae bacterium]|jgi:phospholipid/cholesterol/gamma-HCH transport system substrate-binding protein|nr:phospholipid/cholesterol/gamma-HCH transport system substrate-binding protein [Frankiaceae bacterium]
MNAILNSVATKVIALVVALAAIVFIGIQLFTPPAQKTAVAYLPLAVHLYPGSEVDVLGIKIGTVTSVTPVGDRVRVVLRYDAKRKVPAGAFAVVDEPTLVADRVIELSPVYSGGPVLADHATIPLARTQIPVELDQLTGNLVELSKALGPEGANSTGALGRAISVGAANLRGEGTQGHTTIVRLSQLMGTLGDNRDALFSTVRNLQSFTTELARHDSETRTFTTDLADVSQQLADESASFSAALHNLGIALNEVASFIKDNRGALATDVSALTKVANILARERVLLAHMVDFGAVGISNYPHMYTPSARTYNARFDNVVTDNPALFVCQLYQSVGGDPQQCLDQLKPLKNLPLPASGGKR